MIGQLERRVSMMDNVSWTGMIGQLERRLSLMDNGSCTGMVGQLERRVSKLLLERGLFAYCIRQFLELLINGNPYLSFCQ